MHGYIKIIELIHLSQAVPRYLISMFKIRGLNAKKKFAFCFLYVEHLLFI